MNTSTEQINEPTKRPRGCLFYIGRVLLAIILLPFALVIIGFVSESIMQMGDAERYPAPGQLVDVDGYAMHIYCVGEGSPTIILESGAGGLSVQHAALQEQLRSDSRVCAYDRAGMGWSEARPETRTAWQIAYELHTLLQNASIAAPYVLVGPSNGGLYVRAFAAEYPDETAGLVLLEGTYEATLAETQGIPVDTYIFFGRIGVFRLFATQMCPACSAEGAAAMGASRGRATTWETYDAEWAALQQPEQIALMTERFGQAGTLGDTPLVIIMANQFGVPFGQLSEAVQEDMIQESQAMHSLSSNYRSHSVMSDHGLSDQQVLILRSIRVVLEAFHSGEPIPALG